jgi:hypothetical protein
VSVWPPPPGARFIFASATELRHYKKYFYGRKKIFYNKNKGKDSPCFSLVRCDGRKLSNPVVRVVKETRNKNGTCYCRGCYERSEAWFSRQATSGKNSPHAPLPVSWTLPGGRPNVCMLRGFFIIMNLKFSFFFIVIE